jgi:allophanate hydrolase subunit 2
MRVLPAANTALHRCIAAGFLERRMEITAQSDRYGYRLAGMRQRRKP